MEEEKRAENMDVFDRCAVCQQPAQHRCAGCHKVHYCSKEHQKEDWKLHKNGCKPFKICEDSVLGRHLVATRPIRSGETIIREPPLVWGPFADTIPICLGCGKAVDEKSSRPCSKCGWPVCNELCEKSPAHLPECRYTSQRGERVAVKHFNIPHPIYRCITVLRCLYQKQFLPKQWRKLETLQTHLEQLKSAAHYENYRLTIAEFIRRFFKLSSVFSEEDIMEVYGIVTINSHEVPLTEPPHIAIYGTTSMLEHNCRATCTKSFTTDGQVIISACKTIETGEHLSICYADPLIGTPNRRYFLHETKFFWCYCARCEDPTEFGTYFSALKCTDCDGHLLPPTFTEHRKLLDWTCTKCPKSLSCYAVHEQLESIERDLYELDKSDAEACKKLLKRCEKRLPSNHFHCTNLRYLLSQLLADNATLKLRYCQTLEDLVKIVAPSERRFLANVLFEKNAALVAKRRTTPALADLQESKAILEETVEMLKNEPDGSSEGQIRKMAKSELEEICVLVRRLQTPV